MFNANRMLMAMFLTGALPVSAIGLGDIQSQSYLGERFDVRIPLTGADVPIADAVKIKLASLQTYMNAGVEYQPVLRDLRFRVEESRGQLLIWVSSNVAVNEPIVELLLELETPNGVLQRQYSVLLDLASEAALISESNSVAFPAATIQGVRTTETRTTDALSSLEPTPSITETATTDRATTTTTRPIRRMSIVDSEQGFYGPVARRESLWSIANRLRVAAGVSQQQAMASLFEANPRAFLQGDPTQLMEGSRLSIPRHWNADVATLDAVRRETPVPKAQRRQEDPVERARPDGATVSQASEIVASSEQREQSEASVQVLGEQNRQLRDEISQINSRLADLESQMRQQDEQAQGRDPVQTAESSGVLDRRVRSEAVAVNASTIASLPTSHIETGTGVRESAMSENKPSSTIRVQGKRSDTGWWGLFGGMVAIAALLYAWMWWRHRAPLPRMIDERAWQERKRAARAVKQERNTALTGSEHIDEAPHAPHDASDASDAVDIKVQYVRSAVDTFLLFQRYNEAMAFIRREIFEAGHESVLGIRLEALHREIKEHMISLGLEEQVVTGEAKLDLAAKREADTQSDNTTVTPLRPLRPAVRRDVR